MAPKALANEPLKLSLLEKLNECHALVAVRRFSSALRMPEEYARSRQARGRFRRHDAAYALSISDLYASEQIWIA